MRLKDIPNLHLTTRQKHLIIQHVNDRKFKGTPVVSEKNWNHLPAVETVRYLEDAIISGELGGKELTDRCALVMKVTEFVENG